MHDFWTEFDQGHQGPACLRGKHEMCPHFVAMGGGLNRRRLRLEFGAALCRCSCHARCPLAGNRGAVPFKQWRESCTCPGAEQMREHMAEVGEPPDWAEIRERAQRRSQSRREAFHATRREAAGRSRAEIRDIYVAELRARSVDPPSEEVLAAIVERIKGNPLPSYKIAGEALVQVGTAVVGIARLFRDIQRPPS
jgi:hypothetical protein